MKFLSPINREVLRLAGPSIVANITVPLVGIVDLAIAGHIGGASVIGGIVIGGLLFDLLYWNFSFLRTGTGGITAQAFGRGDWKACIGTFSQGIATALASSFLLLAVQWVFASAMLAVFHCSPEVEAIARQYFFIRIWAAPATLSLFVFKGWFIGMQNTLFSMLTDIWVNVVNMVVSWVLAFHTPLGVGGIAVGTVIAQWTGALFALLLMGLRYRSLLHQTTIFHSMKWKYFRIFFSVNVNLFVRSLLMMVVYGGFTVFANQYGDTELAVSEIMMKMLLLYSYLTDGFAYAGEAMTGRFIGEGNGAALRSTVFWVFFWSLLIGAVSTVAYGLFPRDLVGLLTDDSSVLAACEPYLFWLLLMPLVSCIAFTWDGIFTGATATASLRNAMIGAVVCFIACFYGLRGLVGIQALYAGYFAHLLYRSVHMTVAWRGSPRVSPRV